MEAQKIKNFFNYIRKQSVIETGNIDYTTKESYLKSTKLPDSIDRMWFYLEHVLRTYRDLQGRLNMETHRRLVAENKIAELEGELSAALDRIMELQMTDHEKSVYEKWKNR